jgi:hypothetical protein
MSGCQSTVTIRMGDGGVFSQRYNCIYNNCICNYYFSCPNVIAGLVPAISIS